MSNNELFDDFQPISAKAWEKKIQSDLKGADYDETLIWESPEGIKVQPFYHREDTAELNPPISKTAEGWAIGLSIFVDNAFEANKKALEFLERGVEAILFIVPTKDVEVNILLRGIDIEAVPLYFELQFSSTDYIGKIHDFTKNASRNVYFNIDFLGNLARTGNWFGGQEKDRETVAKMLGSGHPNVLQVDMSLFQNAGADMVQQLAYALGHANEYLSYFGGIETNAEAIISTSEKNTFLPICFKVAVGTNYFFEIAKLRALRLLWKTLASEYGITTDCHIMAHPTKRNKTLYDYNINMLRTTIESMAAVLGGVDAIFNLPYDAIYHKTNVFGERIAMNQLLLLKNESHFDKVDNAADGAYYIENLTQQLAEKALELFKDIEKEGGFLNQLKSGVIQKNIRESAEKEQERFNADKEVLVGTNKYQNPNDKMKDDLELDPFAKSKVGETMIEPIVEKRLAETIEQKRLEDE